MMTIREAVNLLKSMKDYYNDEDRADYMGYDDEENEAVNMAIEALEQKAVKGKTIEPLTDTEQRIFLEVMSREEKVCKEVDGAVDGDVNLVAVCNSIERKVKKALWQ